MNALLTGRFTEHPVLCSCMLLATLMWSSIVIRRAVRLQQLLCYFAFHNDVRLEV